MRIAKLGWIPILAATFVIGACSAEQTEEGELPNVDVEAEGGNLPEYDVETPEVDVTTDTTTVVTPEVEVNPAN